MTTIHSPIAGLLQADVKAVCASGLTTICRKLLVFVLVKGEKCHRVNNLNPEHAMVDLLTVPLASVEETPNSLRTVDRTTLEYREFVDSVNEKGILNPISVIRKGDRFRIVDGLHRYYAARDAGLETIPVQVLTIDESQLLETQVVANVHKIKTKPIEYAKALQQIFTTNPTMLIADMARKLNKSPTWINATLNLLNLEKKIAAMVDRGNLPLSNAYVLAKLPIAEQIKLRDEAIALPYHEFAPIANARAKELRTKAKFGREHKEESFQPVAYIRKMSELLGELEQPVELAVIADHAKCTVESAREILKWVLNLDQGSVKSQREQWEARKLIQEEKREARRKERERMRSAQVAGVSG